MEKSIVHYPARGQAPEIFALRLNLDVFTYIKTINYNEYLEILKDLNIRILDIVAAAGTQLAVPARSIRLENKEHAS